VTGLERLLPDLERVAGAPLRVWRVDGRRLRVLAGLPFPIADWEPPLAGVTPGVTPGATDGRVIATPTGEAWFEPVREAEGVWLEIGDGEGGRGKGDAAALAGVVGSLLSAERETAQVAAELSERYEEIDLIYTITEILGHTIRLDEAAHRILQEVSNVVRARRATLFVHDERQNVLRLVAARGTDLSEIEPIEVDDDCSVAARAFREMRILSYDPSVPGAKSPGCPEGRNYRGQAFLSVPVLYAAPGQPSRPIGVVNLTDRLGQDAFTAGDRKLVAAIANQIGAAIENARLVAQDLSQQKLRRELELAHDLQLKLLPSPQNVGLPMDVAVRCRPAESVGGDFYNLLKLHGDRSGIMIGDVSSHGFSAALIMALAMAASGIHAESSETPSDVLARLEESLAEELQRTEMFLTLCYAVIDTPARRLVYANAGHPHAFLIDGDTGAASRLESTRPPLGLDAARGSDGARAWKPGDLLCLFTDGLVDAESERGDRFGEERVLAHARSLRQGTTQEILEAIYAELAAFTGGAPAQDDRTLLLLKA
jgi:sigma-B regulation protein RsbU (phosphoserine phosphatase)